MKVNSYFNKARVLIEQLGMLKQLNLIIQELFFINDYL